MEKKTCELYQATVLGGIYEYVFYKSCFSNPVPALQRVVQVKLLFGPQKNVRLTTVLFISFFFFVEIFYKTLTVNPNSHGITLRRKEVPALQGARCIKIRLCPKIQVQNLTKYLILRYFCKSLKYPIIQQSLMEFPSNCK